MTPRRDYYRILHVQPDAPEEIIRASYRAIMRQLKAHPDLGGDDATAQEINHAYEILCDPLRRAEYDRTAAPDGRQSQIGRAALAKLRELQRALATFAGRGEDGDALPGDAQGSAEERRAVARLQKRGEIEYRCGVDGRTHTALLQDVSPRGLRFSTAQSLEVGQRIEVRAEFMRGTAQVRSVRESGERGARRFVVGVELVQVSFADARGTFVSRTA